MNGVIRREQEIRAAELELASGGEHELGNGSPVIALNGLHVLAEAMGVHRDLRMHVAAKQSGSFGA
jgi:hypothetical protein